MIPLAQTVGVEAIETDPPLTTIQMACFELACAAVTALRAHVEEGGEPKRSYKIDAHLVVRESTGYPKGAMRDLRKRERSLKRTPAATINN